MEMKNYIGRKAIKAMPMTRKAYNDYRGWELPSDENGEDEGFLVEYVDGGKSNHPNHKGYISWSPKDVFERAYSVSETPLDRLIIEERELGEKTTLLARALNKDGVFDIVGKTQYELMTIQHASMCAYRLTLNARINDLKIKLG